MWGRILRSPYVTEHLKCRAFKGAVAGVTCTENTVIVTSHPALQQVLGINHWRWVGMGGTPLFSVAKRKPYSMQLQTKLLWGMYLGGRSSFYMSLRDASVHSLFLSCSVPLDGRISHTFRRLYLDLEKNENLRAFVGYVKDTALVTTQCLQSSFK